jgi:hypothetical protein
MKGEYVCERGKVVCLWVGSECVREKGVSVIVFCF